MTHNNDILSHLNSLRPIPIAVRRNSNILLSGLLMIVLVVLSFYGNASINSHFTRVWKERLQGQTHTDEWDRTALKNTSQKMSSYLLNTSNHPQDASTMSAGTNATVSFSTTTAAMTNPHWNISIVVQLSGEFGNHLSKVAFGIVIQQILWQRYEIRSHLVFQHQEQGSKWLSPRRDLQTCFPYFRSMDFQAGNTETFRKQQKEQQQWLGAKNASKLVFENLISSAMVAERLSYLVELLTSMNKKGKNVTASGDLSSSSTVSLPFIHAQSFVGWEYIDLYYDDIKRMFALDEQACCKAFPHPDEHVYVSAKDFIF